MIFYFQSNRLFHRIAHDSEDTMLKHLIIYIIVHFFFQRPIYVYFLFSCEFSVNYLFRVHYVYIQKKKKKKERYENKIKKIKTLLCVHTIVVFCTTRLFF